MQSNSIQVELTATRRTALHRYTFPAGTEHPRILVDITNDGQRSSTDPVITLDPETAKVIGGSSFAASFGPGEREYGPLFEVAKTMTGRYSAFTCVTFKGDGFALGKPTEYGAWLADFPILGTTNALQLYSGMRGFNNVIESMNSAATGFVDELGALFTFSPAPSGKTTILARVGVSFISSEQACANAEEEIPDFDFEKVHSDARAQWNDLLGRVQVDTTGVSKDTVQLFYSSVRFENYLEAVNIHTSMIVVSNAYISSRL